MKMEEWKDIPGYEGLYQVSSFGNVRSLNYNKTREPRNLKQVLSREYHCVNLWKDSKMKQKKVHILVGMAFIENPENKPTIDHINRVKSDNHVENLRWALFTEQNINREHRVGESKERYIFHKGNMWRVAVQRKNISYRDSFKTLEEAITARDAFLEGMAQV